MSHKLFPVIIFENIIVLAFELILSIYSSVTNGNFY